jgi:hypothetical protein
MFARLLYYGTVHLSRLEEETRLAPLGLLLGLCECGKQYLGAKPKVDLFIDDASRTAFVKIKCLPEATQDTPRN